MENSHHWLFTALCSGGVWQLSATFVAMFHTVLLKDRYDEKHCWIFSPSCPLASCRLINMSQNGQCPHQCLTLTYLTTSRIHPEPHPVSSLCASHYLLPNAACKRMDKQNKKLPCVNYRVRHKCETRCLKCTSICSYHCDYCICILQRSYLFSQKVCSSNKWNIRSQLCNCFYCMDSG